MEVLPVPELAQQAMVALQKGDKERARNLLVSVLKENQNDERLWLWLSWAVETEDERLRCLEKLRMLNPDNPAARRLLTGASRSSSELSMSEGLSLPSDYTMSSTDELPAGSTTPPPLPAAPKAQPGQAEQSPPAVGVEATSAMPEPSVKDILSSYDVPQKQVTVGSVDDLLSRYQSPQKPPAAPAPAAEPQNGQHDTPTPEGQGQGTAAPDAAETTTTTTPPPAEAAAPAPAAEPQNGQHDTPAPEGQGTAAPDVAEAATTTTPPPAAPAAPAPAAEPQNGQHDTPTPEGQGQGTADPDAAETTTTTTPPPVAPAAPAPKEPPAVQSEQNGHSNGRKPDASAPPPLPPASSRPEDELFSFEITLPDFEQLHKSPYLKIAIAVVVVICFLVFLGSVWVLATYYPM